MKFRVSRVNNEKGSRVELEFCNDDYEKVGDRLRQPSVRAKMLNQPTLSDKFPATVYPSTTLFLIPLYLVFFLNISFALIFRLVIFGFFARRIRKRNHFEDSDYKREGEEDLADYVGDVAEFLMQKKIFFGVSGCLLLPDSHSFFMRRFSFAGTRARNEKLQQAA